MKKKLMNNWSLKLLSLAFAFFIWLSVVSYSNPISTYTISGIPVEFEHEELITERGLSVEVVGKQTATIAVTVNRETSARISADDFKAVADFQDMYQDTQVPVTVTCMTGKVSDSNIDHSFYCSGVGAPRFRLRHWQCYDKSGDGNGARTGICGASGSQCGCGCGCQ